MYQLHNYESFNKLKFFDFLKNEYENSNDLAKNNIWDDNWESNNNSSLPHILEIQTRFKNPNGQFHILTFNNEIIGCSGVYKSQFNPLISLAGSRLWITQLHRNKGITRNLVLAAHKKWSVDQGCKIVALCFNTYNKNLIEVFKRIRLGETSDRISSRTSDHLFFNGVTNVEFPVEIQYTKQWVIYELLDNNFIFDWTSIKWND
jgi:Acetyltransferase (GNAT) family